MHVPKIGDKFTKGDWTFEIDELFEEFGFAARARVARLNAVAVLTQEQLDAITTWVKPTPTISKEAAIYINERWIMHLDPDLQTTLNSMIEKE